MKKSSPFPLVFLVFLSNCLRKKNVIIKVSDLKKNQSLINNSKRSLFSFLHDLCQVLPTFIYTCPCRNVISLLFHTLSFFFLVKIVPPAKPSLSTWTVGLLRTDTLNVTSLDVPWQPLLTARSIEGLDTYL